MRCNAPQQLLTTSNVRLSLLNKMGGRKRSKKIKKQITIRQNEKNEGREEATEEIQELSMSGLLFSSLVRG